MSKYEFITNCVSAEEQDIIEMTDKAKEITYNTFIKKVDYKYLDEEFGTCPRVKDDFCVSFYKSKYLNKEVYYIQHSGIEYIFGEK